MQLTLKDLTSADAVIKAIQECDVLGREQFLKKYGYKYSRLYLLHYNGKYYDSKQLPGLVLESSMVYRSSPKNFRGALLP